MLTWQHVKLSDGRHAPGRRVSPQGEQGVIEQPRAAPRHDHPAVVLDLSANGIGIVRSLGRKGIQVFAYDTAPKYKNGRTRYASCGGCPHPIYNERELLQFLLEVARKLPHKAVLLAGSDDYVSFISKNREALSDYYHFLLPDPALVEAVLDKRQTYELAVKHSVPCPKTWIIGKDDRLEDLGQITFPCILKPVDSADYRRRMNKKAIVVEREDQLKETYLRYREFGELMIQELIPGEETQLYSVATLFDEDMNLLAVFTGQKLHQYPPYFGSGSLARSVKNEEITSAGVSFLKDLGFRGLGMLEYKLDTRDGKPKFLEINPRTWYWHSLSQACGVDLPYMYYLSVTGQSPQPVTEHKAGIKWLYLVRDFLAFREKQRRGEVSFWQWIKNLSGKKEYALFAWDDPLPFFRISSSFLWDAWKRKKSVQTSVNRGGPAS